MDSTAVIVQAALSADSIRIIDTVLVGLRDTLAVRVLEEAKWWHQIIPSVPTAIVAIIGVVVNLVILRKDKAVHDRELKTAINRQWADLADARRRFWDTLEAAYGVWKQEIKWTSKSDSERPPARLDDLLLAARVPREFNRAQDLTPEKWDALRNRLIGNAAFLKDFLDRIHPTRGKLTSIISSGGNDTDEKWGGFYNLRAQLSYGFTDWSEIAPADHLKKKFSGHSLLIIMLIWLEMSLVNVLKNKWCYPEELLALADLLRLTEDSRQ